MFKFRPLALILTASLLTASGCGEATIPPEDAYDPEEVAGKVDPGLPSGLQAKQEALRKVLAELQQGVEIEFLSDYLDDVRFMETSEGFLEGALDLERWDFNGKPTGNDVPVVLFLAKENPDGTRREVRVERVYTVTGVPGGYFIRRKSGP
jgi:hypothetical protein